MDNPLLQKIRLPGRVFQLPSKGVFYKNGELKANISEGEIHVHPMSALAEIHMKSPDQLFSGNAIETVFKECVSGIEKPSDLLAKDVDAILMFLRTTTYGPNFEFTATHTCENAKEHSYIADIDKMISEAKYVDPTVVADTCLLKMPNEQTVRLSPLRYGKIVSILKENEGKDQLDVEAMKRNLMMMLESVVAQVDDIDDPAMIREWLTKIPTTWVTKIAQRVEEVNSFGPKSEWTSKCKDCGQDFLIEIPLNPISFFTE